MGRNDQKSFLSLKNIDVHNREVDPDFIYGWANLGNVLTSLGNLEDALLCYKKAISLLPPKDSLSVILVNRAAIELSLGRSAESIRDLDIAEKLSGPVPGILTNKVANALVRS